jgi:hypothetical protein
MVEHTGFELSIPMLQTWCPSVLAAAHTRRQEKLPQVETMRRARSADGRSCRGGSQIPRSDFRIMTAAHGAVARFGEHYVRNLGSMVQILFAPPRPLCVGRLSLTGRFGRTPTSRSPGTLR